jgi:hypothetical protein
MILDSEEHRAFLLEMIKQTQFPGQFIERACEVKRAVERAVVVEDKPYEDID